ASLPAIVLFNTNLYTLPSAISSCPEDSFFSEKFVGLVDPLPEYNCTLPNAELPTAVTSVPYTARFGSLSISFLIPSPIPTVSEVSSSLRRTRISSSNSSRLSSHSLRSTRSCHPLGFPERTSSPLVTLLVKPTTCTSV